MAAAKKDSDYRSTLSFQRKLGEQIGEKRGIKLGMRDAITKLLASGMKNKSQTAKMLGFSLEELAEILAL